MGGKGVRHRTRHVFTKDFKRKGKPSLSTYLRVFRLGDYVTVLADPSIQKGMPHKFYHGKTGRVWDVTKHSVGVEINKPVRGRIIRKRIHVRIEHVRRSRCREDVLERIRRNEELKAEARKSGVKVDLKRKQREPGGEIMLKNVVDTMTTVAPIPYDIVKEGLVS
eukprot:g6452.t1